MIQKLEVTVHGDDSSCEKVATLVNAIVEAAYPQCEYVFHSIQSDTVQKPVEEPEHKVCSWDMICINPHLCNANTYTKGKIYHVENNFFYTDNTPLNFAGGTSPKTFDEWSKWSGASWAQVLGERPPRFTGDVVLLDDCDHCDDQGNYLCTIPAGTAYHFHNGFCTDDPDWNRNSGVPYRDFEDFASSNDEFVFAPLCFQGTRQHPTGKVFCVKGCKAFLSGHVYHMVNGIVYGEKEATVPTWLGCESVDEFCKEYVAAKFIPVVEDEK